MKSLLDIQKEVKQLETMVQDMANFLDCINREIQEIRTSNDNMEMDYDMIRMLAKECTVCQSSACRNGGRICL